MCHQRWLRQDSAELSALSTVARMTDFDVDGVQRLWELFGPGSALPAELSEELVDRTAGNPKILRSVIGSLSGRIEPNRIDEDDPGLIEVSESWCSRLTARSRELLHALACAEEPMSRNDLARTCSNEHPTTLHGALRPLLDSGLVTVSDGWHLLTHNLMRSSLHVVTERFRTLPLPPSQGLRTDVS